MSIHLDNTVRQTHILMTQVKIFLLPQEEDLLGNQNENKKRHSEKEKVKKKDLLILTLTVCTRSYLSIMVEHWIQPITITLDAKASDYTSEAGTSNSPIRMKD